MNRIKCGGSYLEGQRLAGTGEMDGKIMVSCLMCGRSFVRSLAGVSPITVPAHKPSREDHVDESR